MFSGRREMESLKKELEEELKLSTEDLRSHAWYHGPISREVLNGFDCSQSISQSFFGGVGEQTKQNKIKI